MELDPRLFRMSEIVTAKTSEKILLGLSKNRLVKLIPDDNCWTLCGPLTPGGFNFINQAVNTGVRFYFEKSKIIVPPATPFNEELFAIKLIEPVDIPQIRTKGNQIDITFLHPRKAPIKSISSYLDPEIEKAAPNSVKIEITHNGLIITNHIPNFN